MVLSPTTASAFQPFQAKHSDFFLEGMVRQLGQQTWVHPNGLVMMNQPLVNRIVSGGEKAIPFLSEFLRLTIESPMPNKLALIEGLFVAQKLAELGVNGVQDLYGITSRLNQHPDSLVLAYLGDFYAKLNNDQSFGPALSSLVNRATWQYPPYTPHQNLMADSAESMGEAVLTMVAKRAAQETVSQMRMQMRPELFRQSLPVDGLSQLSSSPTTAELTVPTLLMLA